MSSPTSSKKRKLSEMVESTKLEPNDKIIEASSSVQSKKVKKTTDPNSESILDIVKSVIKEGDGRWTKFIQDKDQSCGLNVEVLPNVRNLLCNLEQNLKIKDDDDVQNWLEMSSVL